MTQTKEEVLERSVVLDDAGAEHPVELVRTSTWHPATTDARWIHGPAMLRMRGQVLRALDEDRFEDPTTKRIYTLP